GGWRPPVVLCEMGPPRAASATRTRRLTLNDYTDLAGRPAIMLLDDKRWRDPVSERPHLGDNEIWEFVNLTDDTHPIHLHMVRFRVVERQSFDADEFWTRGVLRYTESARPPAGEESGWKDTVQCYAGAVTRIVVRFAPYAGRYVWHCHILEHQANAMMRPYEIQSLPAAMT
ncbi:MAG: multicopper oxidase domain-containing protein, partial [Terriglobales bacterium]